MDGLVAEVTGVGVDVFVFSSATVILLRFKIEPMSLLTVRYQLLITMIADIASWLLTLVNFLECMAPVVLASVAAGVEALVAEVALKWLLTRMNSLMHLVVGLCAKRATTYLFLTYLIKIKNGKFHLLAIVHPAKKLIFKGRSLTVLAVFVIADE